MRGQWQIGTAIKFERYSDQTDIDVRLRVRRLIDLKKAWRDCREGRRVERER